MNSDIVGIIYKHPFPKDTDIYGLDKNSLCISDLNKMNFENLPVYLEHKYNDKIGHVSFVNYDKINGFVAGIKLYNKFKKSVLNDIIEKKLNDLSLSHIYLPTLVATEISLTKYGNRYDSRIFSEEECTIYYRDVLGIKK
jgi:hypothetical protein